MKELATTWAVIAGQHPEVDYDEGAAEIIIVSICGSKSAALHECSTLRSKVYTDLGKLGSIPKDSEEGLLAYRQTIRAVNLTLALNEDAAS